MKTRLLLSLALLIGCGRLDAQSKLLTLDDLYHPEKKKNFSGSPPRGLRWFKDGQHYLEKKKEKGSVRWLKVEARTGREALFLDPERLATAFASLPGFTRQQGKRAVRSGSFRLNPAEDAFLIAWDNDLYYYPLGSGELRRLTDSPEREVEPTFSPDGRMVSYVKAHDLYLVDVKSGRERRLTTGGGRDLFHGQLDWVYQEEIYGRGHFKGYWWSPDSTRLAYLELDESPVHSFTVVDHIPYPLKLEVTHYPLAGDPNPKARLGVVSAVGGGTTWIDTFRYQGGEFLLVRVGWTPDSREVIYQVQNREQTWLDLDLADARTGKSRRLLQETSPAWVNVTGEPRWLKDGSFLWLSERSGYRHLYHYTREGKLLDQVTSGRWEVRSLDGVDEAGGWVYFSGTRKSAIENQVYRVHLDGRGLERLSRRVGTHRARFNPQATLFIDYWSDVNTPTQVRILAADGSPVRVVDANPVPILAEYRLGRPQFLKVKTRDGFVMEAMILKPPDFDPARRYPVVSYTYSGPHAPQVRNRWGGTTYLWHQMLAQKGYIIWVCDNRTASGKGAVSTWPVHHHFGQLELRDLEDGLRWLKAQPWVDPERIGLWGWSYGGFMTSYALTHSHSFKIGIAGAPVTDWRLYDTVYTERYMGMPQNNREGYRQSSPLRAAAHLEGKLLILHGTIDDNVHLQNTVKFIYELEKAGKEFQVMFYPRSRHGIRQPPLLRHLRALMTRFILDNL